MKAIFYLPGTADNSITNFHFKMLEEVFDSMNIESEWTNKIIKSKKNIVITGRIRHFFDYRMKYRHNFFIHRFCGIADEARMLFKDESLFRRLLFVNYSFFLQRYAIKHNHLKIVMSSKMQSYLQGHAKSNENYVTLPSFNSQLFKADYNKDRFVQPSFVYVGSLSKWQCAEITLQLFKEVQKELPKASITIFTKESEKANTLIKKLQIKNATVSFVESKNLNKALQKFKYGFLIREDHIVNNVATPTKMNNYLSNQIIPIYSDVIDAFEKNIDLGSFGIKLRHTESIAKSAARIIEHHKQITVNVQEQISELEKIYATYYSRDNYKLRLKLAIENTISL